MYGYGCGFISLWTSNPNSKSDPAADYAQAPTPQWFASKGYIVVVPEYRVGLNIFNRNLGVRAVWKAVQDIRKVIRFCRLSSRMKNAKYYVDTTKPITYLGYSAGAITGLANAYYSDSDKQPSMGNQYYYRAANDVLTSDGEVVAEPSLYNTYDLGTLDNVIGDNSRYGDFNGQSTDVNTELNIPDITVSICGGVNDLGALSRKIPKALLMIQHPLDGVVPCGDAPYTASKETFRDVGAYNFPIYQYPFIFGSCSINNYLVNNTNPVYKPPVYSYIYMDKNCSTNDCLKGDGGTKYFNGFSSGYPLQDYFQTTFYHKPIDYGTMSNGVNSDAETVLKNILTFLLDDCAGVTATTIPSSLLSRSSNGAAPKQSILIEHSETVDLYPNPVLGDIMNITAVNNNTPYRIINMLGQEVGTGKVENGTISVAKLNQGAYSIELVHKDQRIVKRFIKQ